MGIQVLTADTAAAAEWAARRERIGISDLEDMAADVRRSIVTMVHRAGLGHIGGDLSVTDILVTLFGAVLDVDPADPRRDDRDRFVLSKGHCAGALYATLARCGFFAADELETFMSPLSMLNGHPDRKKVPGVETNTGPPGHGFPAARGSPPPPARPAPAARSPSAARSPRSCAASTTGRSWSSETASCRRAPTGRRR